MLLLQLKLDSILHRGNHMVIQWWVLLCSYVTYQPPEFFEDWALPFMKMAPLLKVWYNNCVIFFRFKLTALGPWLKDITACPSCCLFLPLMFLVYFAVFSCWWIILPPLKIAVHQTCHFLYGSPFRIMQWQLQRKKVDATCNQPLGQQKFLPVTDPRISKGRVVFHRPNYGGSVVTFL